MVRGRQRGSSPFQCDASSHACTASRIHPGSEPVPCPPDDLLLERDPELASLGQRLDALCRGSSPGGSVLLSGEAGVGKTTVLRAAARRGGPTDRLAVGHLRADAVADASGTFGRLARSHAAGAGRCGARGAPCRRRALGRARDAARSDPTHRPGGRRCAVGRRRDARPAALPGPAHRRHERAARPELSRRRARQRPPAAERALGPAGAQLHPHGAARRCRAPASPRWRGARAAARAASTR